MLKKLYGRTKEKEIKIKKTKKKKKEKKGGEGKETTKRNVSDLILDFWEEVSWANPTSLFNYLYLN